MSAVMLASHNRKKKGRSSAVKQLLWYVLQQVCVCVCVFCSGMAVAAAPAASSDVCQRPAAPSLPGQWNQPGATTKSHDRVKVA